MGLIKITNRLTDDDDDDCGKGSVRAPRAASSEQLILWFTL